MQINLISSTVDEFQYFACFQTFYAYDGAKILNLNIKKNDHLFKVVAQFDDENLENILLDYCRNTLQYRVMCCEKTVDAMTLEDMRGIRIYLPAEIARSQPQLRPYVCGQEHKTWSNIFDYGYKGLSATYRYNNYYSIYWESSSNEYRFLSLVCI